MAEWYTQTTLNYVVYLSWINLVSKITYQITNQTQSKQWFCALNNFNWTN